MVDILAICSVNTALSSGYAQPRYNEVPGLFSFSLPENMAQHEQQTARSLFVQYDVLGYEIRYWLVILNCSYELLARVLTPR